MIPTMIVFGLVFGRWWRLALAAAAVVWPVVLLVTGTMTLETGLLSAAGLSVLNAGAGVLAHQGVLHALRYLRRRQRTVARTG